MKAAVVSTILFFALGSYACAQSSPAITGTVTDPSGAPIAGAVIQSADPNQNPGSNTTLAVTSASGSFTLSNAAAVQVRITARGFETAAEALATGPSKTYILQPAKAQDTVVVTAYRTPLPISASPASTRVLTPTQVEEAVAPALDGKLRLVPGVELFRRSSSLVANPSSQGLSLRGLGSTAASRTLVVEDDVPLNDPYGGWIHWEEQPELSIRSVEVVRGGASDLYGSSAIGGVVNLLPATSSTPALTFRSSYGGENTLDDAILAAGSHAGWSGLASGGILRTDGYTLIAPQFRGTVDIPNNDHSQNGIAEVDRKLGASTRVFLRGSGFNEARSNGTPLQTNGTRLWRYASGGDWAAPAGGTLSVRLYGSQERFRQSFSSIAPSRATESLTRNAETPDEELGAAAHWTQPLGASFVLLAGADTHDVRATDFEDLFKAGAPNGFIDITARQRQTGAYGEALWTPSQWTLSASARVDHFSNFDASQWIQGTLSALPAFSETVFDPRLGIARRMTTNLSLAASAFRAYRAPTQNELYRTGQVGQQITQPNPNLRSERATGWEAGAQFALPSRNSTLRASYFWTAVNRPITALTLSSTPTSTLLQRENLGQIESRGVAVDFQTVPLAWISVDGGYQYANATVTKDAPQTALIGNWIPQVARNMATAEIRVSRPKLGVLSFQGRISGHQFDDDANAFRLSGYFRLDTYASHQFGRHVELFATANNLFDRSIQVGHTPLLTLGTPLVGTAGLRVHFGE
jgi:outer membrane receptor protein involved in Fe transport